MARPLGCVVQVFKTAPGVTLEKAVEPARDAAPVWSPLGAGGLLMNPHRLRFGGQAVLRMGSSELKWEQAQPSGVTDLGRGDMVVHVEQEANLYLERAPGFFTHSAFLQFIKTDTEGFYTLHLAVGPIPSMGAAEEAPSDSVRVAAPLFDEILTVMVETWICLVEQSQEDGMVVAFIRFTRPVLSRK